MKKLTMILAVMLLVCLAGSVLAETTYGAPGKNVEIPVTVDGESTAAVAVVKYSYDGNTFEYVKDEATDDKTLVKKYINTNGTSFVPNDGKISVLNLNGLEGTLGGVTLKVKDAATLNKNYDIKFSAEDVWDANEQAATLKLLNQKVFVEKLANSFMRRCYTLLMARDAVGTGELDYWAGLLESEKKTAVEVVSEFVFSNEFKEQKLDNENVVNVLYQTALGREPDASGKTYWISKLEEKGKDWTIATFCGTNEFKSLCEDYGIIAAQDQILADKVEGFVRRCFWQAFGRNADDNGLAYWMGTLNDNSKDARQVAEFFLFQAPEMTRKELTPGELIDKMFLMYLGRNADESGKNYWLGEMEKGLTEKELSLKFAYGTEFQNILTKYGMKLMPEADAKKELNK